MSIDDRQLFIFWWCIKFNYYPFFEIVFIMVVTGLSGVLCMITDIPIIQVYSFTALMSSGIPISVINAATVELYPTALRWVFLFSFVHFFHVKWYLKNRAMAMCISLMFGRLGGVVGANTVALLLDNHCQSAFYLSGSSLLGMLSHFQMNSSVKTNHSRI